MSIVAIGLMGDSGGFANNSVTIEIKYQVQTSSVDDTRAEVIAAVTAITPPVGYRLKTCKATRMSVNPLFWDVDAGYDIPNEDVENPLDRPSRLNGEPQEWVEKYFVDSEGVRVMTSAFEVPSELPERGNGRQILTIEKNLAEYPADAWDEIKYTRNAEDITIRGTIYAAGKLLFLPVRVSEEVEKVGGTRYRYFKHTFRLVVDKDMHVQTFEDRGLFALDLGTGEQYRIWKNGRPVEKPWPLDDVGQELPNADDEPNTFDMKPYPLATWGIDFN